MSKLSRWLFLILALFLLVMLPTKTAFASEQVKEDVVLPDQPVTDIPSGAVTDNSQGQGGGAATDNNLIGKDGINSTRSGYLIWLSDSSGRSLNGVIAIASADGRAPYSSSGRTLVTLLNTRFGEMGNKQITSPIAWGVPFFNSANDTNVGVVDAFMKSPHPEADNGAVWVAVNYLGYTKESLAQLVDAKGDDLYLNVQPWLVGGIYGATEDSHSGIVIAGTIVDWATYADSGNYLGRYTHGTLANAFAFDKSWLGLSIPPSLSGKHSSSELLSPIGWGIVSYKLKAGDKDIIKTYYDSGTLSKTSYGTTTSPVDVKDEGSYIVKEWFTSKTRTKLSGNQEYPTFESELSPKVQSGSGTSTVTMPEIEKTIVIRLEREEIPMVATSE